MISNAEIRANRKAVRFPGRIVWLIVDKAGVDHCLLACSVKGKLAMAKSFDPATHEMTTLRNRDGSLFVDGE